MRKITAFILALALTLSLLVTAGAADGDKVHLVITPTLGKNGHVFFAVDLKPSGKDPITVGAFQFAVTVEGGTIVADSPNTVLLYDGQTHSTGYFEQFGGGIISEGKYKFVAAGTIPNDSTIKDVNGNTTTIPARIWKMTAQTPIVTLEVQMAEDVKSCQLVVDTTSDSRFSVGSSVLKDGKYTVQETCTGTATSTPYTPASTTGVTVSGTAVSWNNTDNVVYLLYPSSKSDADIKAEWKNGNAYTAAYVGTNGTINSTTVDGKTMQEQSFTFTGVASGDYKLVIFKHGKYVPKIVPINVGASDYTCGQIKLWLYGDVNYDGKIRTGDATLIYSHLAGERSFSDDQYSAADITCDGKVRTGDATQIYLLLAGESSKFDNLKN